MEEVKGVRESVLSFVMEKNGGKGNDRREKQESAGSKREAKQGKGRSETAAGTGSGAGKHSARGRQDANMGDGTAGKEKNGERLLRGETEEAGKGPEGN
ncbi:MAG: hypothetical protein DELT_03332 [Desulfovibrio sp.]